MKLEDYRLAYAYKKTKLWQKMRDDELFAVKMENRDDLLYLCVMGKEHGYCALGIYPDEESFQSYYRFYTGLDQYDLITSNEVMLSQDGLQCAFDNKDNLSQEEVLQTKQAAKKLGIRLAGKNAFAHYLKFEPYTVPHAPKDQSDAEIIRCALKACIDLSEMLKKNTLSELGIHPVQLLKDEIPVMEQKTDQYVFSGYTRLPGRIHMISPMGMLKDAAKLEQLKKMRKRGVSECRILHILTPVEDEEPAYFPLMLLNVDEAGGQVLSGDLSAHYVPDEIIDHFADRLIRLKRCPAEIQVEDEQTEQLLKGFCAQAGIRLSIQDRLDLLHEAYETLIDDLADEDEDWDQYGNADDLENVIEHLSQCNEEELHLLPENALDLLEMMLGTGILTREEESKMKQILKKAGRTR